MMKKLFVLALAAGVAVALQAGEGEGKKKAEGKTKSPKTVTKEQFIASQKKMAEKKGAEFDQAKAEARFAKLDKNKDGKLTPDEQPQKGKSKAEGKDKAKAQDKVKAQDKAEGKDTAEGKAKGPKAVTKEQFIANQKKAAEKKGAEFDQAKAEARFAKLDKNKDGKLTPDEQPQKGKGRNKGKDKPAE